MSTIFREYERQLVELARRSPAGDSGERAPRPRSRRLSLGVVVPVLSVLVAGAILLGALASLHGSRSTAGSSAQRSSGAGVSAQASLKSLLAEYAVLRKRQTVADRALAGRAPVIGATSGFAAGGGARGHLTSYFRVRISGLSHYEAIPRYTRVVVVDRVRVALFVERYVRISTPPKIKITGSERKQAEKALSNWLARARRRERSQYPDLLVARVARERPQPIITAAALSARQRRLDLDVTVQRHVTAASLPAPDGKIVAIEPNGVTAVKWQWPREWDAALLRYLPPTAASAPVSDNVGVATAPARFSGSLAIGPYIVTVDGPNMEIGRYVDANNSPSSWLTTFPGWRGVRPSPQTARSRQAQRNPATPNRVHLVPASVSLRTTLSGPGFMIEFRDLLNDANYYGTITDDAGRACVRPNVRGLVSYGAQLLRGGGDAAPRGTIFAGSLPVMLRCRGSYRVSVGVIGPHGKRYAPFGSATLTVR